MAKMTELAKMTEPAMTSQGDMPLLDEPTIDSPDVSAAPDVTVVTPIDINIKSDGLETKPSTGGGGGSGIVSGLFRSVLATLISEIQKSENKSQLLDNVITPITRHMTGFIITFMKDQFYTQFIAFIAAIAILCIFNILIIVILIYSRR